MTTPTRQQQLNLSRLKVCESLGCVLALTERQDALGNPQDGPEKAIARGRAAEVDCYMHNARCQFARFEALLDAKDGA